MYIRYVKISIFKTVGRNSLQTTAMTCRSAGHVEYRSHLKAESYMEASTKAEAVGEVCNSPLQFSLLISMCCTSRQYASRQGIGYKQGKASTTKLLSYSSDVCNIRISGYVVLFCQHVPTSIRKKSNTVREQPPRLCKNNNSKINCEWAIGQHQLMNPECAKPYTDDNFRIIGQGRSSFHLSVLESVYIKTQNPVLCKQKDFIFLLGIFK